MPNHCIEKACPHCGNTYCLRCEVSVCPECHQDFTSTSINIDKEKMKKTIWKYPLQVTDLQNLEVPIGSELLTVQTQDGVPCLWVLVHNAEGKKEIIKLTTIGTGNEIKPDINISKESYIGTYQLHGGAFVGHVFRVK